MALKTAAANGNWSTAATWNSVTNTPTLHASTNIAIDTTARFTATFTAPNTSNACTGVLLYINAVGSGGTVTVTLQESTVDTAAARTLNITALVANSWVYFRFATPYTFTTTGAGAYRFKIQATTPAGTTNAAADSGGSLYCYLATDDRTGAPGTTDDIWIVGQNQSTAIAVTMDGTQTIGNGTNTTGLSRRTIGSAITICNSGLLSWDTAASATLTCKGNILSFAGGELRIGTVASPYPASFVATLAFNENGTSNNFGLETWDNGKLTLQGTPKSSTSLWKTTYSSGAGTAASPLIVADSVDWAVGDEIIVCAYSANATNYQESENKFIKTKNSATSYVLSDTVGGAEAALTYTHTAGAYVLNIERNVIIKSTTTTECFYWGNFNTTAGDINVDWTRFTTPGLGSNNSKQGLMLCNAVGSSAAVDYSVAYGAIGRGFYVGTLSSTSPNVTDITYTGLIACNQSTASGNSGPLAIVSGTASKTFISCFAVKNHRIGFDLNGVANIILTNCVAISNNLLGTSASSAIGGFVLQFANNITATGTEFHCNRNAGMSLATASGIFTNALGGTRGAQVIDINATAGAFNLASFVNGVFGSATLVNNYLLQAVGSEVRFQTLNSTTNNHIWYTATGIARSAGAGLVDTTTKTAGNLAVRLAPENLTTGFIWDFLIGIRANTAAQIVGFAQKNAAFGTSVCTVELFLPGSTVADATATLDNTTGSWQVFNLAASYTGSVAAFATIRITAKTTTAAAYVYFADFYNGTNVLTGLQAWYNGKPSPVLTDLLGDPASVWAILTSTLTTSGTVGKLVVDNLNATVSSRSSHTAADVWAVGSRTLTSFGTLIADIWAYASRTLTAFGFSVTVGTNNDKTGYSLTDTPPTAAQVRQEIDSNSTQLAAIVEDTGTTIPAQIAGLNNLSPAQVWDLTDGIEIGLTPRQAFRLVAAAQAGLLSGAGTTTITIKNAIAGDKNRIIATVDSDGNRTAITYDVS